MAIPSIKQVVYMGGQRCPRERERERVEQPHHSIHHTEYSITQCVDLRLLGSRVSATAVPPHTAPYLILGLPFSAFLCLSLPFSAFLCRLPPLLSSLVFSSTFLTTKMDAVPAVIAPTMCDIITLSTGPHLWTWTGDSRDVFKVR